MLPGSTSILTTQIVNDPLAQATALAVLLKDELSYMDIFFENEQLRKSKITECESAMAKLLGGEQAAHSLLDTILNANSDDEDKEDGKEEGDMDDGDERKGSFLSLGQSKSEGSSPVNGQDKDSTSTSPVPIGQIVQSQQQSPLQDSTYVIVQETVEPSPSSNTVTAEVSIGNGRGVSNPNLFWSGDTNYGAINDQSDGEKKESICACICRWLHCRCC